MYPKKKRRRRRRRLENEDRTEKSLKTRKNN